MKVRATKPGYDGWRLLKPGDEFEISTPHAFSPYWMEPVEAWPDGWESQAAKFDPAIDHAVAQAAAERPFADAAAYKERRQQLFREIAPKGNA